MGGLKMQWAEKIMEILKQECQINYKTKYFTRKEQRAKIMNVVISNYRTVG